MPSRTLHAILRSTVAVLAAAVLSLHAAAWCPPDVTGDHGTVEAILARADRPDAPSPLLLAQQIIDLGMTALPKTIDALVLEAQRADRLSSRRSRVVYSACAIAGVARWRPIVEARLVAGCSRATLSATCALTGECGLASELSLLMRVAALDAEGTCRHELEHAITSILERDRSGFGALDALVGTASANTQASIVGAVEATKKMEAAVLLSHWIGERSGLRLLVLPHLARLAVGLEKPFGEEVMHPVRILLDQVDSDTLPDAILCAGRLRDCAAIPALTRWLREGDSGVRADALWSLRQVSGLVLDEDPALWSKWFAEETGWWEHESQAAFAELRTGTRCEKIRALRSISCLHAWHDRLVEHVAVLLDDGDPELAAYGARMLGHLGSRLAVPALLEALESNTDGVAEAAHAALEAVAGSKLPSDPAGCREALGASL